MSDTDEIEDSSAPLIEHLAELRTRLIPVGRFADNFHDRVEVVDGDAQPLQDMRARFSLGQFELGTTGQDFEAV